MEKPRRGRPLGQPYPVPKIVRLTVADAVRLRELAERWNCREAEVFRRLLRACDRPSA